MTAEIREAREAPAWLLHLADHLGEIRAEDLSRRLPAPEGARRSAVLILFGPLPADLGSAAAPGVSDVGVLLTQRSATMRSHPGQVAFPGGGVDPGDDGPVGAALREAEEETGLDPAGVRVLGRLPDLFLPPSGNVVAPVLGWWDRPVPVAPGDPREVARVVVAPLADVLDPGNRFTVRLRGGYEGPGFAVDGLFVWGFTAGLLARLLTFAGLEQPWDTSRFRPLPSVP